MITGLFHIIFDDRRILTRIIFPYFARNPKIDTILFVGCKWYTKGYNQIFTGKNYRTLEIAPNRRRFGAAQHITDSIENLNLHFEKNELDLIICNGVFGWGLDAKANVETAFQNCFDCLKKDGVFILGWNDIPKRRPFPLENCNALKLFNRYVFPPLSTSAYLTGTWNRHQYNFYIKP